MYKEDIVSQVNQFLGSGETLKALNLLLKYLHGQGSHLEEKLSRLRNNILETDDLGEHEKIKNAIYKYLEDLPEINQRQNINKIEIDRRKQSDPATFWGFLWRVATNPKYLLLVIGFLLFAYFFIRIVYKDPLCILFNDCSKNAKSSEAVVCDDAIKTEPSWAERNARAHSENYALLSVIVHITLKDVNENGKKSRKAYYRTVYTLRSFVNTDSFNGKTFQECYSSVDKISILDWAGSEKQEAKLEGGGYWVKFSAKRNDIKTIITGADFTYPFPLPTDNQCTCFLTQDIKFNLKPSEWMACYGNDEDYIDRLTILIEGDNVNIKLADQPTRRAKEESQKVNAESYTRIYPDNSTRNTLLATWENVGPGDCVGLKIEW